MKVAVGVVGGVFLGMALTMAFDTVARHWEPERYEVTVREVENGYVIKYGVPNNPYLFRESIAKDAHEAAQAVEKALLTPIKRPRMP